MLQQKPDGPTANVIMYFGLRKETAEAAAAPEEQQSSALRHHCRYWATYKKSRKIQETMKLMCYVKNLVDLPAGSMLRMFSNWNGKPVLVTRSGTVYSGKTKEGVPYAGVDINLRCWAFVARNATSQCCHLLPNLVIQVGLTIEGDHHKRGGQCDDELPEQL